MQDFLQWNRQKWEQKNRFCYKKWGRNCFAWYYAGLDYDIHNALRKYGVPPGKQVCDLGTCSGSQALGLALEGYAVIGTDISQTALDQAKALAANYEGLTLEFQYDDVLDSQLSPGSFDAIFDRGRFHSLYGFIGASGYTNGVLRLLKPGGILVLKMMNDAEKRFRQVETIDGKSQTMPYHFRRDELDGLFGPPFRYLEITETVFQSSVVRPDPIAWMVVLRNEA